MNERTAAASGPPPAVVEGLSAGYPGVSALEDVTLELASGGITALLGANGSGKSTLFASLLGLLPPRTGTVLSLIHI